jgi:hypothetical protein
MRFGEATRLKSIKDLWKTEKLWSFRNDAFTGMKLVGYSCYSSIVETMVKDEHEAIIWRLEIVLEFGISMKTCVKGRVVSLRK